MLAVGGSIGTGLFVALGESLSAAGPGGTMVAYLAIGVMIYFVMMGLGEMGAYMPISGSFETYGEKFIDPAFGFAMGWNYWYYWAITIATELVAASMVVKFWLPEADTLVLNTLFMILLVALNLLSVKAYGESEYWFAGIKVITIIVFLIVGTLMITGIMGGKAAGMEYWFAGEAPFVGGAHSAFGVFVIAGFSFMGVELVGIAAGESENPAHGIPKAARSVFWRNLLFYLGSIFVVGCLIPYNEPNLLRTGIENISVSPFTLIFERAGLAIAASFMNAVILTSVLTVGNSGVYAASRMLFSLAEGGKAPAVFAKLNKRGVPVPAIIATMAAACVCYLTSPNGDGTVFVWLVNACTMAGFIAWFGIALSHYRFRKAIIAQGRIQELKFKSKLYPFGPIFAMITMPQTIIGQGPSMLTGGHMNWFVAISYLSIPLFVILYFGYKVVYKTKIVKAEEADLNKTSI